MANSITPFLVSVTTKVRIFETLDIETILILILFLINNRPTTNYEDVDEYFFIKAFVSHDKKRA